ncbi:hypothetical protein NX059_010161 [Plenodomus lindquistii]|nr:hypothetical protein NX059_010161 [Plenodomus lindquistii]
MHMQSARSVFPKCAAMRLIGRSFHNLTPPPTCYVVAMAEIAGTAVGIVSLSIEICRGLVSYIDGVKNAKSKAEKLHSETERLANLLELLDNTIEKLDPNDCIDASGTGIVACADALESIRKTVGDDSTALGSKPRSSFKVLAKRLAAPFKEADVKYKKDVLNSIQLSLQTALHALQIDQQRRDTESTERLISQFARSTMSGMQDLSDRQQQLALSTASQSHDHRQLLLSNLIATEQNFESLRYEMVAVQRSLQPLSTNATSLATLSQLGSALIRIESKLDQISPCSTIASVSASSKMTTWKKPSRPARGRCTCQRHGAARTFLRWPISVAYASSFHHNTGCPLATSQEIMTDLRLEVSICSFMLGRHFKISLGYSSNSSSTSIPAGLECIRFVTEDSPGFKLLGDLHASAWHPRFDLKSHLADIDACAHELTRHFETRQISAYDRLLGGQTFLHYACEILPLPAVHRKLPEDAARWERQRASHWAKMIAILTEYMPLQKNETDGYGMTCLDIVTRFAAVRDLPHILPVAMCLLKHDVRLSSWGLRHGMKIMSSLPLKNFPELLLITDDLDEGLGLILCGSRDEFEVFVGYHSAKKSSFLTESFRLYEAATRAHWREGCSIMHEAGIVLRSRFLISRTLLEVAVEHKDVDMVRFWLNVRKTADKESVDLIGDLARAYGIAACRPASEDALETVLTELVQQRRTIREMMEHHDVTLPCTFLPGMLLDAHANCALSVLEEQCIDVPAHLYPETPIVYSAAPSTWNRPIVVRAWQRLFESGFQDISKAAILCHHGVTNSSVLGPYIEAMSYYETDPSSFYPCIEWLLEHGASLEDPWEGCSGCNTTAAHLIGTAMARRIKCYSAELKFCALELSVLHSRLVDECSCSCSTRGCLPVTAYWKTRTRRSVSLRMTANIKYSSGSQHKHWKRESSMWLAGILGEHVDTITEIIRLILFTLLDLRHTCCNFENIIWRIRSILSSSDSDFPIHQSAAYIRRVKKEDAYLASLLEELVPKFDAAFDVFGGTFSDFVKTQLMPQMEDVLERLKEDDKTEFGQKRREMGVWMESDDEEEDEQSVVEVDDDEDALDSEEDVDSEED